MANTTSVLYVEDEENDAFFMQRAFKKLGIGHSLQWVSDGLKAIAYLAGKAPYNDRDQFPMPSVILLDLNLGFMSGFDVLDWLRAQPEFVSLPVVIFSSSNNPLDRERAFRLGATDFVPKPRSSAEFPEAIAPVRQRWLVQGVDERPASTA